VFKSSRFPPKISVSRSSGFYIGLVVGLVLLSQLASAWSIFGLAALYPFIQDDMGLSRAQVGSITSCLLGGAFFTVFAGGWLSDISGVRKILTLSLVTLGIGTFLLSYAGIYPILLIGAVILGILEGPGFPASTRAIMDWSPDRIRGFIMSIKQTGVAWAAASAAAILPILAVNHGWRISVKVLGCAIFVLAVIFALGYRDPKNRKPGPKMDWTTLKVLVSNRGLVVVGIWGFVFVGVQMVVSSFTILFLIEVVELSEVAAGGYIALAHASSIFARVGWGVISDWVFHSRRLVVLNMAGFIAAATMASTYFLSPDTHQVYLTAFVIVLGISTLSYHGVWTVTVGELAGTANTGTALGAVNMFMRIGMIIFPPIYGLLVDKFGSYPFAWSMVALVSLVATLGMMVFGIDPRGKSETVVAS